MKNISRLNPSTRLCHHVVLGTFVCLSAATHTAFSQGTQQLHAHAPAAIARLQPQGLMPRSEHLHLAIGLPLREQAALSNLFAAIYDPASPEFHRYLTPEQFTERFGPSEADYQALQDFVTANGLTVTATHPNRVVLEVNGAITNIEKMLHVTMRVYNHPTEARTFYAPDREPSVDLAVPILHISGLDTFHLTRPMLHRIESTASGHGTTRPNIGSGPNGTYIGSDFRKAYLQGVTNLTGAGQSVGLFQLDGFYARDITNYANATHLTVPPIVTVPINGGVTNVGGNNLEVALDIEMVMSMAPGATIYVYENWDGSTAGWDAILSAMVTNTACKQFSSSYIGPGPNPTAESLFIEMAIQGQSFFNASADYDSFLSATAVNWPGFPTDSPNITDVGGTTLTTTANGNYSSETVWNWGTPNPDGGYWGSSGGYSTDTPMPTYQAGISNAANVASTRYRNVPDVALTADNIYVYYGNGQSGTFGGTSCASPLWAGFMANVNQEAAALGKAPAGFINPAIYDLGKSTNYNTCFHDITTGNNEWPSNPTSFPAVTGYDLATGWGSPSGTNLINALIGPVVTRYYVTTLADSGLGSLRQVAGAVQGRGAVAFATNLSGQTITLTSGEIAITNSLTIDASALPNGIIINGNHNSRIFNIAGGVNVTLNDLVLTNGYTTNGNWGGAIFNAGTLALNYCTLAGNSGDSTVLGGAIANQGPLTVLGCTFSGNSATFSGAIDNRSTCTLQNSTFYGNTAFAGNGGAVANTADNPGDTGILLVTNCIFQNNVALGQPGQNEGAGSNGGPGGGGAGLGGALYTDGPQVTLSGCSFTGDVAGGGNGGNGDGNSFNNDPGGNGGAPNGGLGGAGGPGGAGGYGGGGGGGAGSFGAGFAGGAGGFGGGGGGGGAAGAGGSGGTGGAAGSYAGAGGLALFSHSGGGGGGAGLGGALFASTGLVTIANCSFTSNIATNGVGGAGSFGAGIGGNGQGVGGAVINLNARITAVNLSFSGNSASTASPDVEASTLVTTANDDGTGSLRQALRNAVLRPGPDLLTFAANLSGSVIHLASGYLDVNDSSGAVDISAASLQRGITITGDGASRGFYLEAGSSMTLDSLRIVSCYGDLGGAVLNAGNLTVHSCTIASNLAQYVGGIYSEVTSASLVISDSTLTGNSASNLDGAIFAFGPLDIRNSTIVGNSSTNAGGGVRFNSTAILENNIIAQNTSASQPDVGVYGGGSYTLASYNFIGDGTGSGLADGVNGNHVGTSGAPLNPQLSPLKYFGGPTPVLHPLVGSPVIDAGDPAFNGVGLVDQRGWPRVWGGRVDIGAVEFADTAGNSVSFDGATGFLILSNAALSLPTDEITVEFWERVAMVRDQFSFILYPDVASDRCAFSSVRANFTTYWDFGDLFNGGRTAYPTPLENINQWTHWALVSSRAGNFMKIYRNGQLDFSTATNRTFVPYAGALVLGARLDASDIEYFQGEMDEFRIWSVARTQADIQANMSRGLCPPQTNLWLYWKFNEPSGAEVFDYSGNGRNGLLFNGAARVVSLAPLLAPGGATITRLSPTQLGISWTPDTGCLTTATNLTGPWTAVPSATNGQIIVTGPGSQFFRVTQ